MNIGEIVEHIYHVTFPGREELAHTFLRFQEHYESPQFREKVFSLDEFKEWYLANNENAKLTGRFTYAEDWSGFNIPSYVMEPFYGGAFDPLTRKEKRLLAAFEGRRHAHFYVIGTVQDEWSDGLMHEIAHGLFYTDPSYKKEVLAVLEKLPSSDKKMTSFFKKTAGYHPSVFVDETYAYLLSMPDYVHEEMRVRSRQAAIVHDELGKVYATHMPQQR